MGDIDRFVVVMTGGGVPPVDRMPRKWAIVEVKPEGHPDSPALVIVISQTDARDLVVTVSKLTPEHHPVMLISTTVETRPLEVRYGPE